VTLSKYGITYEEPNGSGTLRVNPDSITGRRTFRVYDKTDAEAFLLNLIGRAVEINDTIVRVGADPFSDTFYFVTCQSARMEGHGVSTQDADGNADYAWWEIVADYETLPFDPEQEEGEGGEASTYVSEEIDYSARLIEIPRQFYSYADGTKLDQNATIRRVEGRITITWHRAPPTVTKPLIASYMNTINATAWRNYDAETLLFNGARRSRRWLTDGTRVEDVQFEFLWNGENSWNTVYRPATGAFEEIDCNGNSPYSTAEFSDLITEEG
jgi:hypothetical protein